MSDPQLPDSERKFFCHFTGGGMNIIVTTVMADFLRFLIGYGYFRDYFHYLSGVSSGATIASASLIPSYRGSNVPLHPDFRKIRHQILGANDEGLDHKSIQGMLLRQTVAYRTPSWVKEFYGVSRLFNWLVNPDRLYLPLDHLKDIIMAISGSQNIGLNALFRPFLCPSIEVGGDDNHYFLHSNQPLETKIPHGPVNEKLVSALLMTMGLVPLIHPDEDDPKIDGGFLFSGISAAKILAPHALSHANITIFDCMDAPERTVGLKDLKGSPDRAYHAGLQAERRANRRLEEVFFNESYPSAKVQTFSRHLRSDHLMPHTGPIAKMMNQFSEEYCGRSYAEVINTPISPIDLFESIANPSREIHSQMVNQAIRACVAQLPAMVKLAKEIIRGPLARHCHLSRQEQNELIDGLNERLRPALPSSWANRPSIPIDRLPESRVLSPQ